jgi:putative addiction module component (TIGR02574 family)
MAAIKDATKAEILEKAKKLSREQRCELIDELKATLPPPPPDGMTREEFRAELDRRSEECDSGRMIAAPSEDVIRRLALKNRADD